jgi:hypothetical protein
MRVLTALYVVVVLLLLGLFSPAHGVDVTLDQNEWVKINFDGSTELAQKETKPADWDEEFSSKHPHRNEPVYFSFDTVLESMENVKNLVAQAALANLCNQTSEDTRLHQDFLSASQSVFKFLRSMTPLAEFFGIEKYFNDVFTNGLAALHVSENNLLFVREALKSASRATSLNQLHAELSSTVQKYLQPESPADARYINSWFALLPKESQC